MTDAQQLFDFARKQFNEIADDVERHFNNAAAQLREQFGGPLATPPARRPPPPTTYQVIERWVWRHKALSAAVAAFLITGSVSALVYVKSRDVRKRRRAKKSASGARTEVVVVVGAVANPLTSALYLDLERRGFVVYVVASTLQDEHYIRALSRADLVPLSLNLSDPCTAQEQLARFENTFTRPHYAFDRAEPHKLHFRGLILVPDTKCTPQRVEDTASDDWSDALNAKVLNTIAGTQLLLPAVIEHKAKVLLLTPSVAPDLKLPMHAVESTVYGALQGFATSLSAELRQDGISVSHFKLGTIDIPADARKQRKDGVPSSRLKPTPVRRLHDAVFDELVAKRSSRTIHIGRGSLTYAIIGSIMPPSFIAWMLGVNKRPTIVRERSEERMTGSAGSLTWEKVDQEE